MPAAFVAKSDHYDAGTAWPSSLTISGAPSGTARGDRLFLVVLAYNTPTTLDNWNVSGDWTLLQAENGTAGVGGQRSSIHVYTARHQDGAPLPLTISPRTSGGTLITDPGGAWYRAHLFSVGPSHPVNGSDIARGDSTSNQPDNDHAGLSGSTGDYAVQLTAVLNPNSRTLGTLVSPGGTHTYTDRASMTAVTGRGGDMRIADATSSGIFSGDISARFTLGGTGGSINVRSVIITLDADPDPPLPGLAGIYRDGWLHAT